MARNTRKTPKAEPPKAKETFKEDAIEASASSEEISEEDLDEDEEDLDLDETEFDDPEKIETKEGKQTPATKGLKLSTMDLKTLTAIDDYTQQNKLDWDAKLTISAIPLDCRAFLDNLHSRKLIFMVKGTTDEDFGQIKSIELTMKGQASLENPVMKVEKAKPEPTGKVGRPKGTSAKSTSTVRRAGTYDDPKYRIAIVSTENPRRADTNGHHSFNLYRNGMTLREYLDSAFDAELFNGPDKKHFDWDLVHGYIAVYDSSQPQYLDPDDKYPNPDFWVARNKLSAPAAAVNPKPAAEQARTAG